MKNNADKYTYRIAWSEEDGCHIARCLEFPSLSAHGDTIEAALREMTFVVKEIHPMAGRGRRTRCPSLWHEKVPGPSDAAGPGGKARELAIRSAEERVSRQPVHSFEVVERSGGRCHPRNGPYSFAHART
jgi:hypothetical protein